MPPTPPRLSVVIPAYNEERRLGPTLQALATWLDADGRSAEVLVVDDGSRDDTTGVVERFAANDARFRLLRNGRNRGKGYSVGHGVAESRGERVLFSDADLSTPISELPKLEAALEQADIAIGSRALATSQLQKRQPLYRETMGRAFNLIVRAVAIGGIHDTQCGFKLFQGEVARRVFAERRIDGFAFDVEILYVAQRLGYRVAEVPVVWVNDEASRVDPVKHSLEMLRDTLKVRLMHRKL